jgi:hypothetical protein
MEQVIEFFVDVVASINTNRIQPKSQLEAIATENGRFAYVDDRRDYMEPLVKELIVQLESDAHRAFLEHFIFQRLETPSKLGLFMLNIPKAYRTSRWKSFTEQYASLSGAERNKFLSSTRSNILKTLKGHNRVAINTILSTIFSAPFPSKSDDFPDCMFPATYQNNIYSGGEILELKDSEGGSIASFNSTLPTHYKTLLEIDELNSSSVVSRIAHVVDFPHSMQAGYDAFPRKCFYFVRTLNNNEHNLRMSVIEGSFFETMPKEKIISETFKSIARAHIGDHLPADMETILEKFTDQSKIAKSQTDLKSVIGGVEKRASINPRFRIMSEVAPDGNPHTYPEIPPRTLNLIVQASPSRDRDVSYRTKRTQLVESFQKALKAKFKREFTFEEEHSRFSSSGLAIELKEIEHKRNGLHSVLQFHF